MNFEKAELKKVFDFILVNKNIDITNNDLFNRDTLINLRNIIKNKKGNDFELSTKQKKALINAFLTGENTFDEETPKFIIENEKCITASINRDVNSADYITDFKPELKETILGLALKNNYILTEASPDFLNSNYTIALNSIRNKANSADYVDWRELEQDEKTSLIDETIKAGYTLSSDSANCLRENPDVVLASLEKDITTIGYATSSAKNTPRVFKYLLTHGYDFSRSELRTQPLTSFADKDILKNALKSFTILDPNSYSFNQNFDNTEERNTYINKYSDLYATALKTIPTINTFDEIFKYSAEVAWEDHKSENMETLTNVFGKICSELQDNDDYGDAVEELELLETMEEVLPKDRYDALLEAMNKYHTTIHSNQQLSEMEKARNEIAKISALYIAISKENYKKEKFEEYNDIIDDYFIPRKDNPVVYKRIIDSKYKQEISNLFDHKDDDICNFMQNEIVSEYSKLIDEDTVWRMIRNFLNYNYHKLDSFIKAPHGFNNYKRHVEASKLVNRLNRKYIKYTDNELTEYRDIIKFDPDTDEYYYDGPGFSDESIEKFEEYRGKQRIFEEIKQKIIFKARTLDIDKTITYDELTDLMEEFPFNDDYFEFDQEYYESSLTFDNFLDDCINVDDSIIEPESILDDKGYETISNFLNKHGIVWLLAFLGRESCNDIDDVVSKQTTKEIMDNINTIIRLSNTFHVDLNSYPNILSLVELSKYTNEESISIVGVDLMERFCKEYCDYRDIKNLINIATDLVAGMVQKQNSTVPYVEGQTVNFKYSLYDTQDESILMAGIDTDACFRVNGVDNDFLHYCALDKNGFVIKITDNLGNFIGRASGFRNGNCVFINQLRTIYDEGGSGYECEYEKEKEEIIETFKQACNNIVQTSQNNPEEREKIDFVFVTQSYSLDEYPSNVEREVEDKIGSNPMVSNSEDWRNFVNNTENLRNCSIDTGFTTDYGNYDLICMACSKPNNTEYRIKARDIKMKDVPAVYSRKRSKIVATTNPTKEIFKKINRTKGIYSRINCETFEPLELTKDSKLFVGDNWFIVYENGEITNSCVLDFDLNAEREYLVTKRKIEEHINRKQTINIFDFNGTINENAKQYVL